jgi:hypothetical protein
MNPEERTPKPLDWFPIVKRHIERLPVRMHAESYNIVNKELGDRGLTYTALSDMLESRRLMIEVDLHELIEYYSEDYFNHRRQDRD